MAETKASRLQQLARIAPVPPFVVVERADGTTGELDGARRYMVRSSGLKEDQAQASHAGQLPTLGPLAAEAVPGAVERLLAHPDVDQVIVQEYVEAEVSGVAFCFSEARMLVEYSARPEGVTAGKVNPFTALLPTGIPRYAALQPFLARIHDRFGACDVEFIGLREPRFVQVRPITRETAFDQALVELKMQLQELEDPAWVENDFCRVLAERMPISRAMAEAYLRALPAVYADYLGRKIEVPARPFIRVSDQFFMNERLERQLRPGMLGLMRLGFRIARIVAETREADLSGLDATRLMEKSILMSLAQELFGRKEAMALRERIRQALEQRLAKGELAADFHYHQPLAPRIAFDPANATWEAIGPRDRQGITVVEGDLETGPFFHLQNPQDEVPEGVVVITEQLYPELGSQLDRVKGIICRYGALSSHLAILAREQGVPLRIQADIERYVK